MFFKTFFEDRKLINFMGILLFFNRCLGTKVMPKQAQNRGWGAAKEF